MRSFADYELNPVSRKIFLPGAVPKRKLPARIEVPLDPAVIFDPAQPAPGSLKKAVDEIFDDFDRLLQIPLAEFASDCPEIEDQPIWELGDRCFENFENGIRVRANEGGGEEEWIESRDRSHSRPRELLAYYCPAHTNRIERYGIHILKAGVAKIAGKIRSSLSFNVSDELLKEIILLVIIKFTAHEHCHSVIEDLCTIVEFLTEESGDRFRRTYSKVNERYGSYLFMEEAICNSVAAGALDMALNPKDDQAATFVADEAQRTEILHAFHQWMRNQPKGYRDFIIPASNPAYGDRAIRENIERLLIQVYGYRLSSSELRSIAETFFNAAHDGNNLVQVLSGMGCFQQCNRLEHPLGCEMLPPVYLQEGAGDPAFAYDEIEKLYPLAGATNLPRIQQELHHLRTELDYRSHMLTAMRLELRSRIAQLEKNLSELDMSASELMTANHRIRDLMNRLGI